MTKETIAGILGANPWFQSLAPPQFQTLVDIASEMSWEARQTIFRENQQAAYLYLILEGQVALEMYMPGAGRITILTLGPADIFGWSAVTPVVGTRTASVRTVHPTRVIAFDSQKLRDACEADHDLGFHVYRRLTNVVVGRLTAARLQLLDMYAQNKER